MFSLLEVTHCHDVLVPIVAASLHSHISYYNVEHDKKVSKFPIKTNKYRSAGIGVDMDGIHDH